MGIVSKMKKSLFGKMGSYMLFKILAYLMAVLGIKLLTNILTEEQYGTISLLESTLQLCTSVFLLGLPQAYIRFYYDEKKEDNVETYDANYIFLCGMVFVVNVGVTAVWFVFKNHYIVYLTPILALCAGLSVFSQQLLPFFRVRDKVYLHSFLLGLQEFMHYIFVLGFVLWFHNIESYFIGGLISAVVMLLLVVVLLFRCFHRRPLQPIYFKKLLQYGAPLLLLSLGVSIFGNADRLVIGFLYGEAAVAHYTVPSKISHVVQQLLLYPINMILFPYYIKLWSEKGREETESFLTRACDLYLFISVPMIAGAVFLRNDLTRLLSNDNYTAYSMALPILLSASLLYGCYYFVAAGFHLEKKTVLLGATMFASSVVNIGLNFLLGKFFGILGVCVATAVSYIVFLILGFILSKKIISVRIRWLHLLRWLLTTAAMYGVMWFAFHSFAEGILRILLCVSVGVCCYMLLNVRYVLRMIRSLKGDSL